MLFRAAILAMLALPCAAVAQPYTVVALDIATVTTGGVAVEALAIGNAARGGFVMTDNAAGICVNILGTAGTSTTGNTACVAAGQPYHIIPTNRPVSVNSSASSVAIAGNGAK